jgi:hypothetical protein
MIRAALALMLLCSVAKADPSQLARHYLAETATPGGTMLSQGVLNSLDCLNPKFALALAAAIQEARQQLPEVGVYSACRPPVLGVGGFQDKHKSLHAYGLAVDMHGIGRPGSQSARYWHNVATSHGLVNPYGYRHGAEWNHYQATRTMAVGSRHPLRNRITARGPIDLPDLWEGQGDMLSRPLRMATLPVVTFAEATVEGVLAMVGAAFSQASQRFPEADIRADIARKSKAKTSKKRKGKKKRCKRCRRG